MKYVVGNCEGARYNQLQRRSNKCQDNIEMQSIRSKTGKGKLAYSWLSTCLRSKAKFSIPSWKSVVKPSITRITGLKGYN